MLLRRAIALEKLTYSTGSFGSLYRSEALIGALPQNQNSPQKVPYGLHTELISGTAFTLPRSHNRYSWVYRIRPSVQHVPQSYSPFTTRSGAFEAPPIENPDFTPEAYRFRPRADPSKPTDFIDGLFTIAANGAGPVSGDGAAAHVYAINESMTTRVFRNHDAEMLIVPQEGSLLVETEFGNLEVDACEILLIPRGITFRVNLGSAKIARGYVLENFGAPFVVPELGPIGISSGLAHPRHFVAPTAKFDESPLTAPLELISKLNGKLFHGPLVHSPFDVVAWYGSHVPLKYDLRLFMPINAVGFDHPDPSIGCVLQSPTATPGVSNIDFVVFPPRWMVAENTFRPPWFHRNVMSEFMGLIQGRYDAKPGDAFVPGASSVHNQFSPHGPDAEATTNALSEDTGRHTRYDSSVAFMWESNKVWVPTTDAMENLMDADYAKCWNNVPTTFDRTKVPVMPHPLPFGNGPNIPAPAPTPADATTTPSTPEPTNEEEPKVKE